MEDIGGIWLVDKPTEWCYPMVVQKATECEDLC